MKILIGAFALVIGLQCGAVAASAQKRFDSLDDAVNALTGAIRTADRKALIEILGPAGRQLLTSGDDVADSAAFQRFVEAYDRAHRLEGGGGKVVLYIGNDDFPFPIPLVPEGPRWRWDPTAGAEEALSRQIGQNELGAIQVCLAYVDAEREYYSRYHDGARMLEYAHQMESTRGRHDGLVWETRPSERESPLGPLVAQAQAAGYPTPERGSPVPYYGYLYRMLFAQGPDAPGGAYDFAVKGHMIGGFALVSYPATYGVSGVMTFIVSHDGVVYEKDLGRRTAQIANAMKTYNPDPTWTEVDGGALKP